MFAGAVATSFATALATDLKRAIRRGTVPAVGALLTVLLVAPGHARANPEPPATYDARVTGMAGAAAAVTQNATGLFHNPAQLEAIERFSTTVVATSLLVNLRAPFAGPGTERDSGLIYAPLVFLGAAGRVHDRVVIGGGAYVYTGFGGGFRNVDCLGNGDAGVCGDAGYQVDPPADQDVTLFVAELAVPIQITLIPKRLSLGISLRLPWARQDVGAHQDTPSICGLGPCDEGNPERDNPNIQRADQTMNGFGIPGILLGLSVQATDALRFAFVYRSKVWIDMEGTTTLPGSLGRLLGGPIPTTTRWYVPHMVRAGVAHTSWNDRFTIAFDFRYQFHREANERQTFDLSPPPAFADLVPTTVAEFQWKDAFTGMLGMELWVAPRVPIRVGFSAGRSASNPNTLTPFSPPPGLQLAAYVGFGVHVGPIDIDMAFGWGGGPEYTIQNNRPLCVDADSRTGEGGTLMAQGGCAGSYDVDSWFLSLSATYSLERDEDAAPAEECGGGDCGGPAP